MLATLGAEAVVEGGILLSIFQTVAGLLTLTAVFAWVNHHFLHLPSNVGLLLMGLAASLVLIGFELLLPNIALFEDLHSFVQTLDFSWALLNGMLAFLLFAGALQIDLSVLHDRAWTVGVMATLGVVISTIVIALAFWAAAYIIAFPVRRPDQPDGPDRGARRAQAGASG